jgi:hypothetical protein
MEKIHNPDANTLYQKVGNKYVPVAEHVTSDYFRNGSYLVIVRPGRRSITSMVFPKTDASIEAALEVVGEGMVKIMLEAARTPTNVPKELVPKQIKAFKMWKEAFHTNAVWFPSTREILDAGLVELRKFLQESRS